MWPPIVAAAACTQRAAAIMNLQPSFVMVRACSEPASRGGRRRWDNSSTARAPWQPTAGASRTRSSSTTFRPGVRATSRSTTPATSWCARTAPPAHEIDLLEVVQGLQARDLAAPVVVRFSDILAHRLRHLHDAFARAIAENDYRNRYAAVFPIKVNQQRLVVEEVYRYGKEFGFGLEVGSKPELLAVMAMTESAQRPADHLQRLQGLELHRGGDPRHQARPHDHPGGREFRRARADPAPRRRPTACGRASACASSWRARARAAGAIRPARRSKFGLFITEILELLATLRGARHGGLPEAGALPPGQPAAGHPPRQGRDQRAGARLRRTQARWAPASSTSTSAAASASTTTARGTNYASSMNYTLDEYANDVVYRIASVCNARGIAHPMIISESGRAIAAHHSVLIFNTLGSSALDRFEIDGRTRPKAGGARALPQPVRDLLRRAAATSTSGAWSSATTTRRPRAIRRCRCSISGCCRSSDRGLVERLYWAACARIRDCCRKLDQIARGTRGPGERARRTSTSAISRCSSRCPTAGRSTSCSRSCRSTGCSERPDAQRRAGRHHLRLGRQASTASSAAARPSARSSCTN